MKPQGQSQDTSTNNKKRQAQNQKSLIKYNKVTVKSHFVTWPLRDLKFGDLTTALMFKNKYPYKEF